MLSQNHISQNFGDYPKYVTPDNEMIARMLHLSLEKNKLDNEKSTQLVKKHTAEYKIDNRSVYDILDRSVKILICIYLSNTISSRAMEEGHFMPSTPGGSAQIM